MHHLAALPSLVARGTAQTCHTGGGPSTFDSWLHVVAAALMAVAFVNVLGCLENIRTRRRMRRAAARNSRSDTN